MAVTPADHSISSPAGTLFARSWQPAIPPEPSRPTFLLFHDSLGCVDLWRDFPARLAETTGLAVVAYDRLGFGRSDPHPGPLPITFTHDEAKTSVRWIREALGVGRMIPFGHSVGGSMAIATAAQFADSCDAAITESAQAFVEDRTLEGIRAAQADFARPGQVERLARYHGDKARWVLSAWIDTWLAADFAQWNFDADLRATQCPVLALHGELDEFGSPAHPRRIARFAGGASRAVLRGGCGHVPHREQPERVLDEVDRLLRG
jgi:pimeloyl-ACP methyl ester carboxylesterase